MATEFAQNLLACRLAELTDQLIRGSHVPTRVQLLQALDALKYVAAHDPDGKAGHLSLAGIIRLQLSVKADTDRGPQT